MDADFTFNGNFNISGGVGAVLYIPAGVDIYVAGDMGDPDNNGVIYQVDGTLHVEGTLYGKNNNAFTGTGTITGGTLNVKNGGTCPTPCPVTGGFESCISDSGSNTFCDDVLPVKLLYFNVHVLEESIELKWATIMEEDFALFIIQRSADGLNYEDVGEVPGAGFNIYDIESRYSFEDRVPLTGFNYFRLKAVDLDGSFEHFPVKAVKLNGPKKIAVYPNPSSGEIISFRTNFSPSESDRIILTDQLGVEVYNGMASSTRNSVAIENRLLPGIYMLRYVAGGFEQTARVVVKN